MTASFRVSPPVRRGGLQLALCVSAACACWPGPAAAGPGLADLLRLLKPGGEKPAPTPAPALAPADAAVQQATPMPGKESPADIALRALFAKGTVDGSELVDHLKALQERLHHRHKPAAPATTTEVAEGAEAATAGNDGGNMSTFAAQMALKEVERKIKPYLGSFGVKDLAHHMKATVGNPQWMAQEKITLPKPEKLTMPQMRRIVTMAAVVVATRITGNVLRQAQKDFAGIEDQYTKLIERREKAASLLYGALLGGAGGAGGAAELAGVYADADLKYLRDSVARMSVKEFSEDMGAQNLALGYLKKSDPAAFAEYQAESGSTLKSTQGYIRTVAGGAAFAALVAVFTKQVVATFHSRQTIEILASAPIIFMFLKEVPPVLKAAWAAGAAGIVELPMKANKRFRVAVDQGSSSDLSHSADVFAAIKAQGAAEPIFTESLFRNGGDGLLYKLYRCDRAETGRLLDVAVPPDQRDEFANDYIAREDGNYSFLNAFTVPTSNPREQELGDELLRDDQRKVARRRELGNLQRSVTEGYGHWGDEQLMRMIFANREGVAAQATLQLGELRIRPIPSAQSLYAYESLIDGCKNPVGGGALAADSSVSRPVSRLSASNPNQP